MVDKIQSAGTSVNRPLSPHLQIYRLPLTAVLSIMNRMTGIAMIPATLLIVAWFLAAATGAESYNLINWFLTTWLGLFVLIGSMWAFWFHFINGLRHLRWDAVKGMDLEAVRRSDRVVIGLSVVVTVLCIVWVMWGN